MKKFFKLFGVGAASFGLFLRPAWKKAFTIDESAEGIDFERSADPTKIDTSNIAFFSVNKERELANDIALNFHTRLGKVQLTHHAGGQETLINIMESVRAKRVYLICSFDTSRWSFNETLVDLFLTISALKRCSPEEVNVVLPYFAYSRQSSMLGAPRKSIFSADIATILETVGADKVFTVNLHAPQINGYFNIPLLDIDATGLCAQYFKNYKFKDLVLVCANDRLFAQAVKIQEALKRSGHQVELGILLKQKKVDVESKYNYIGRPIKGRDVLVIDNIIDTGSTLQDAANCIHTLGARDIYMFAVHGIFSADAVDKINNSGLKEVVITNTLPLNMLKLSPKINQVSVAPMLAETIAQAAFNKKLDQLKQAPPVTVSQK